MKLSLWKMFMMIGMLLRQAIRAGSVPEPLKCWCRELIGIANRLPGPHSNVCDFPFASSTLVAPLPVSTKTILSKTCFSAFEMPARGNLREIAGNVVPAADEMNVSAQAALPGRRLERLRQAVNGIVLDDRHALFFHPLEVAVDLVERVVLPILLISH